jgi:hypothetical protein
MPAKGAGFLGLRDKVRKRRAVEPEVHSRDDQVVNGGEVAFDAAAAITRGANGAAALQLAAQAHTLGVDLDPETVSLPQRVMEGQVRARLA